MCELFKRYNALQHKSRQKAETLAALETQRAQMEKEADAVMATPVGDSAEAQKLRTLENRLEKSMIKCNEATHIRKTYEYIEQKLQQVEWLRCAWRTSLQSAPLSLSLLVCACVCVGTSSL